MRGEAEETDAMFSYISPAQRVPKDHPLRVVRQLTDQALARLSPEFEKLYSSTGRPSVPPERLLRASLLQYFYGIRSERLLMEQLEYNLLFRWFVGLGMDDRVWTPPRSRRAGSVCCREMWPGCSWRSSWPKRGAVASPRMSTSAWMGRSCRPGRDRRVSSPRMSPRRMVRGGASVTSAARSDGTTLMPQAR